MRLAVVTGVIGRNDMTKRWLDETIGNCTTDVEIAIVANGSTEEEYADLRRMVPEGTITEYHSTPIGTSRAFNRAVRLTSSEAVAVLQSDLLIKEKGWDEKVLHWLATLPEAGVLGFAGARQLGADFIYHVPYEFHQLGRSKVYNSLVNWEVHGHQCTDPITVACLDGLAMCFLRERFEKWGGYDERYFHHMYDMDMSVSAHWAGFNNYAVPILCDHIGGQSVGTQAYYDATKDMGEDIGVHRRSHDMMYQKWFPYGLPVKARDVP